MSDLWAQREALLSTEEAAILDKLYKGRKAVGSLQSQKITYTPSNKSGPGKAGYGRLYGYGGHSLEQISSEIRGTLCKDVYHDVDMVNCQPTLLANLASHYDRRLPVLDLYVSRREEFLAELMSMMDCSRAAAKAEVLKVFFGGATSISILRSLQSEIREFALFLASTDEWSDVYSVASKDERIYSFMSHVLGTEERRCLLAMDTYLTGKGWNADVFAYDGLMVRKRGDAEMTPELLAELETAVHTATGYSIKLTVKPMVSLLPDVPSAETEDSREIVAGVSVASYKAMKARFEENHFYLAGTCKICAYDPEKNKLHQLTKEQAVESLIEWHFPASSGKFTDNVLFVPLWLKDPTRRMVKDIVMGPATDDPTTFVMPYKPAWDYGDAPPSEADRLEAIETFKEFVDKLIPDVEMRSLFIEWLAHLLQKPFENSKTCVVLAGGKGCGKDTLGDFIGVHLLGAAYFQDYDSTEQFWNTYDTGRFGKLFVKVQEAQGCLNRKYEANFKARITALFTTVNPKQKEALTTSNYTRYLLTTNEASPVKLDEMERRFVIIQCSPELILNKPYFDRLYSILYTPAGAYSVAMWLMEQPIGAFPRILPKSDLHKEIIDTERTTEERFAMESGPWAKDEMTATELYPEYRGWCLENGLTPTINSRWFGRHMSQVAMDGKVNRRMLDGVSRYSKKQLTPAGGAGL